MSHSEENSDPKPGSESPESEFDPICPTEIDPRRAFEMGLSSEDEIASSSWSPPAPEALDPLFPDFEITGIVGRGGMGAVYQGVQKSLDRTVAIKLLPSEMAEIDPSFTARFEHEAKAMARLHHPNIVTVFDFGQTSAGHYYIVMEFVDGMDFHQLIQSGQLDTAGALKAVSQICDALEYAHAKGYVHRDIKPANVFINREGILKVGDFGLAKIVEGDEQTAAESDRPDFTRTGVSMGTPGYCAPEQIDGHRVDHRADIYSLGVMFYEMLTRELPRGNFPPPSQKVQVDVRIDSVVLRAMESEPERRYSSAGEMRTDVEEVRASGPVAESSSLPGRGESDANQKKNPRKVGASARAGGASAQQWVVVLGPVLLIVAGGLLWYSGGESGDAGEKVEMISSTPEDSPKGSIGNPSALALTHRPVSILGTGTDARMGFDSLESAVSTNSRKPTFLVPEELRGEKFFVTPLFLCKEDSVPMSPENRVYRYREVGLWVPTDPVNDVKSTRPISDGAEVEVIGDLKDGAYCFHSGTMNDPDHFPVFSVPFVVNGIGMPELVGVEVFRAGDQVHCRVKIKNTGKGTFHDGLLILTLQKGAGDRAKFQGRENVSLSPIAAGEESEFTTEWEVDLSEDATYYFYGHVNYRHLWDVNSLVELRSDDFTVSSLKEENARSIPTDSLEPDP